MNSTDKCPHCGADAVIPSRFFRCGSWIDSSRSDHCTARAARQKAEAELTEARKHLDDYRAICLKQHAATVKAKETEKQLEETCRKLEQAADLIAKLKPFLRHNHPRCVTLCECGLNKVIMDAGRQADVVKADAAAKKGGGV